eukprot:jgi/Botrbrau1/14738/Bobra.0108s0082.1
MTVMPSVLEIARVDLSLPEEEAAEKVREACKKEGFFYVVNHGVPEDLLKQMFDNNKAFFDLPLEEKRKILVNKAFKGYTPMSDETLDPGNQKAPDSKEGLYFGIEPISGSEDAKRPLRGPNQWPSEDLVPGYRRTTEQYIDTMMKLAGRLNRLLAIALNLPPDYFDDKFTSPLVALRPLHYNASISNPTEGLFGCGAHTDYGQLTILATDNSPGLQLFLDNKWCDVPPMSDAFVINLGDLLERWSNGLFKSTRHRVISVTGKDRYSIPFFFEPNYDVVVECLPTCSDDKNPPKYPPITVGEHIHNKYNQTHNAYKEMQTAA